MNRPSDNDHSNPISRAFSKLFGHGDEHKTGTQAARPATPATRAAPGAQAPGAAATRTASATPRTAPATQAPGAAAQPRSPTPLVGAAAGMAHPDIRQTPVNAPASSGQPAAPATAASQRTYTVVKGDSLSKIAQQVYGRADRWHLIFEANRNTVSDPDRIYPGQVLVLPDVSSLH